MKISARWLCFLFFMSSLFSSIQPGFAQVETKKVELPAGAGEVAGEDNGTVAPLDSIIESLQCVNDEIKAKERDLKAAGTEEERKRIADEINKLKETAQSLEKNFAEIASGVDLASFESRPKEHFDWKEEIQDLLGPIVQELKSVTARPREIEKLRTDVSYYEQKVPVIKNAVDSVHNRIGQAKDQRVKGELKDLEKSLKNRQQQLANQLSVAQYQLAEKLKERDSVLDSAQNILRIFFKSRGRNLILALLAFTFAFLLFRGVYRYIYRAYPNLRSAKRSFYLRFAEVSYHAMTFTAAVGAALVALYISGDWVLLGLSLIFLFGLAWTAKQALPRFFEQGKLLLNLGTVRENERIIYKGLPWKVGALNVYTQLVNPELRGGTQRIRLRELIGLNSRPYDPDEPWFPCKEGDWVILADETQGKVVTQTPEMVQLVLLGGSRKTYHTEEFLKQNPINISTNFRLNVTFGIDYEHQNICTREVPERLREMLLEELDKEGYGEGIIKLQVEFKQAAASSLDLEILADFSGRLAKYRNAINRAIQRIAVEACNKHGWVIPFTQITVHTANSNGDTLAGAAGLLTLERSAEG